MFQNWGTAVDIEKLREFVVLSKTMNFTKAAAELNVSQPALSKHIGALEREVGFTVLKRGFSNKGPCLTAAGKALLEKARGIIDAWDQALAEAQAISRAPAPARVQGLYYCINLNPQIKQALDGYQNLFGRLYEYVDVRVDIRDALDSGLVDFVVHHESQPKMLEFSKPEWKDAYCWIALEDEPLCFVVGANNPLVLKGTVTLDEVMKYDVINQWSPAFSSWYSSLSLILARHGMLPRFRFVANDPRSGLALPIGNDGVFLCTQRMAAWYDGLGIEDVSILDVVDFDESIFPFLVFRADNRNQNVRRLAQYLDRRYPLSRCRFEA